MQDWLIRHKSDYEPYLDIVPGEIYIKIILGLLSFNLRIETGRYRTHPDPIPQSERFSICT